MDLVGKSYMLIGYGSCHGSIRHYQKELLVLYVAVYRRRFLRTERLPLESGCLCFDVSADSGERTGYPKECVDKSQTQRADYQSSFV